jgi:hypothetical protein
MSARHTKKLLLPEVYFMFNEQARQVFADLDLPFSAVAVNICRNRPEGLRRERTARMYSAVF